MDHSNQADICHVKALFSHKKWRQCIHVCETQSEALSDEDERRLFFTFYLAMAHDELARQMYDVSKYKIGRFDIAERYYEDALSSLTTLLTQQQDSPKPVRDTLVRDKSSIQLVNPLRLPRDLSSISLLSSISSHWSISPRLSAFRCHEHMKAMREQLLTHLRLIKEAKQRANAAQAKRQAANVADSPFQTPQSTPGSLQASKSYWLFTSDTMKSNERQKRIQKGRERGWTRERFQPAKYRALAERALAEL